MSFVIRTNVEFQCMRRVREVIAAMKQRPEPGDIERLRQLGEELHDAAASADDAAKWLEREIDVKEVLP